MLDGRAKRGPGMNRGSQMETHSVALSEVSDCTFAYLLRHFGETREVLSLGQCGRRWRKLAADDVMWQTFFRRRWHAPSPCSSWLERYKGWHVAGIPNNQFSPHQRQLVYHRIMQSASPDRLRALPALKMPEYGGKYAQYELEGSFVTQMVETREYTVLITQLGPMMGNGPLDVFVARTDALQLGFDRCPHMVPPITGCVEEGKMHVLGTDVVFATDEGHLYCLDPETKLVSKIHSGDVEVLEYEDDNGQVQTEVVPGRFHKVVPIGNNAVLVNCEGKLTLLRRSCKGAAFEAKDRTPRALDLVSNVSNVWASSGMMLLETQSKYQWTQAGELHYVMDLMDLGSKAMIPINLKGLYVRQVIFDDSNVVLCMQKVTQSSQSCIARFDTQTRQFLRGPESSIKSPIEIIQIRPQCYAVLTWSMQIHVWDMAAGTVTGCTAIGGHRWHGTTPVFCVHPPSGLAMTFDTTANNTTAVLWDLTQDPVAAVEEIKTLSDGIGHLNAHFTRHGQLFVAYEDKTLMAL